MEILDDGHFVEAVATAGAPLYFWHAGYDRLDVIPRGQKGEVENLGEVVMKPSTKPGGVVKGIMHSFLSGVPKDLNARIEYSIPVINRCGIHDLAGRPFERDLLARLKFPGTESVDFRPETGEFKISGLPEIRFFLSFHSSEDEHDAVLAAMEISPGEETDLGLRSMAKPLAKDDATTPISELEDWAPNGKEQVKKMLTQLEGNTLILKYFREKLDADVRKVDEWRANHGERSAVVIVGKAEVPGNEFARSSIMAQMDIADGGYFCAAVRPGLPVGFRLHGYEPLDYVPKGSRDGVEFCGILRMKKTPVRDTALVESSILFEGGQAPPDLQVTARECFENVNWGEGGLNNDAGRRYAEFGTRLQPRVSGNRFKFDRLSPIPYDITVSAFGRTHQVRRLNLQKDDHRTLVPFTLFRDRNVTITLLPSKDGNFVGVSAQQSTIPANGGELRSTEDPAMFEDRAILTLLQSGNSISNIGPGSLDTFLDLGHRGIDECRVVNGEAAMPRNYNTFLQFSLREGHVYLFKDWNLGGPCALFRVDSVSLAPINGK